MSWRVVRNSVVFFSEELRLQLTEPLTAEYTKAYAELVNAIEAVRAVEERRAVFKV